jgi:hypothetical protein
MCLATDARFSEKSDKSFICICPDDYSGDRCQHRNSRIDIKFSAEIIDSSSSLSVHIITANGKKAHTRTTILSRINFYQTHVRLFTPIEFHIIFAQIFQHYYLISLLSDYIPSRNVSSEIRSSQRCLPIDELFDATITNYHSLRRAKYYHQACRKYKSLPCFYDHDTFLCLCTNDRHANCFNFDFNLRNDCEGNNYCLNSGQCLQDIPQCPTRSVCVCQDCFYGSRCQFSTKGYGLSLDAILSYHIRANITFSQQPKILKTSASLVIIIFALGIISSSLSIITFSREKPRQVGCGIYLLVSSIICLLIMLIFVLKCLLLVLIQSEIILQPWIVKINCVLMDFLLRILLNKMDWLNACVAIERVIVVLMGVRFNKAQSRKVSYLIY